MFQTVAILDSVDMETSNAIEMSSLSRLILQILQIVLKQFAIHSSQALTSFVGFPLLSDLHVHADNNEQFMIHMMTWLKERNLPRIHFGTVIFGRIVPLRSKTCKTTRFVLNCD